MEILRHVVLEMVKRKNVGDQVVERYVFIEEEKKAKRIYKIYYRRLVIYEMVDINSESIWLSFFNYYFKLIHGVVIAVASIIIEIISMTEKVILVVVVDEVNIIISNVKEVKSYIVSSDEKGIIIEKVHYRFNEL